jgi:hypothetical protein
LQDNGSSGTSYDTIAIVFSVLVGAVGYMVQAWSTRRADRSAAERAVELQHSELTRQREHGQMVAQIERTERWLDQCCRPVLHGLATRAWARPSYVQDAVFEMETSHPEVVVAMLSFCGHVSIGGDGKSRSVVRSGALLWDPDLPAQLTGTFGKYSFAPPSAAAMSIYSADLFATYQQPLCFELPQAILDVVATDPTGAIAESYRRYVRTVLVPGVQAVAELLKAHAAVIEWPSKEWLIEQFPDAPWSVHGNDEYGNQWNGYALSWDRVLTEWDSENFAIVRPAGPMAFAGLWSCIAWSRTRGEAKQRELIGMTAEAEINMAAIAFYADGVSAATVASTGKTAQLAPAATATFETEHTT